jgi:polyphenol oxidase
MTDRSLLANPWMPTFPMNWSLPAGVRAVCTTRQGGVSVAPYDSLNLGDHVQDAPEAVQANRALLQRHLGARPVFLHQVHGVTVLRIDAHTHDASVADACWTNEAGVACTIMVADCLPLLFCDASGSVVGAAHAGWRGLAGQEGQGVVEHTVQALCRAAACDAAQLRVWLGPCIGPQAFEVGGEVRQAFASGAAQALDAFRPHPVRAGKWLADLAALARMRLRALGVTQLAGNDSSPAWCTVTRRSEFFSYRRDGVTGRMAVSIWRQAN